MQGGNRVLYMAALVIAGEAAFVLPFLVARVFRPTLLDVFGITNLQLGSAFSLYGLVAMLAYLPGGPLADRFPARWLLALGLVSTAAGGVVYARIPSIEGLTLLFGFWGVSSILVFWSALIRATRQWGGLDQQGRAFGLLDGGRGLFAAVLASVTLFTFDMLMPEDVANATLEQRALALSQVIWIFTGFTAVAGVLVLWWIPDTPAGARASSAVSLDEAGRVFRRPTIWLQALIVLCAYVGYKGTDDFSLYARDGFGMNDVEAATVGTISFWLRPIAALAAGLLGDRIGGSRAVAISFAILFVADGAIALGVLEPSMWTALFLLLGVASASTFALRGLYFALFVEARVPTYLTGTAVGVISVIGYTPDVFMGPVIGVLTDSHPGAQGHENVFAVLAGFAALGFVATIAFQRAARRGDRTGP